MLQLSLRIVSNTNSGCAYVKTISYKYFLEDWALRFAYGEVIAIRDFYILTETNSARVLRIQLLYSFL